MKRIYDEKKCECGNTKDFEWRGCGGYTNGDYYTELRCKKCGKDIKVNYRAEEPKSTGYYHDGGWYRDNE